MLKVVLIEDEYYFRMSLKRNIPWAALGLVVIGDANNGIDAFDLIQAKQPDIAVVDINMPGMNGIELLQSLRDHGNACDVIILSGYDEFQYAQRAMKLGVRDYVLKPVDYASFERTLAEIRDRLLAERRAAEAVRDLHVANLAYRQDDFLNDLINCNLSGRSMATYDPALADSLVPHFPDYAVAVLHCEPSPGKAALQAYARALGERQDDSPFVASVDRRDALFLVGSSHGLNQLAATVCNDLVAQGAEAYAGVGLAYQSLDEIYLSCNEARLALKNRHLSAGQVIPYADIRQADPRPVLDDRTRNSLRRFITDGMQTEALQTLDALYQRMVDARTPYSVVILHTLELVSLLVETLTSALSQPVSMPELAGDVLQTLESCHDVRAMQAWLAGVFTSGIARARESRALAGSVTGLVQDYIDRHYADPQLSVKTVSDALYLNYSYICYCFKRDKHVTINDYLTTLRIDQARQLFAQGHSSVSYVSQRVGFDNPGYFSRRFRKATGLHRRITFARGQARTPPYPNKTPA